MSYLKLCQISNDNYVETADGEVILDTIPNFPQDFQVEVIDWVSEDEFHNRGKIISFESENVGVQDDSKSIRESVYEILLVKYPNLIK